MRTLVKEGAPIATRISAIGDEEIRSNPTIAALEAHALAHHRLIALGKAHDEVMGACLSRGVERLMEGRTTLIIAHRLSTGRALDRLLVFDKARIVEEGDHQSLVRLNNGIYRRLFERQALELTKG